MEREEILSLCLSNPMAIVAYIESLETELNNVREEIRNLKALLNQNSQNSNKPPSTDTFVKKKTLSNEKKGSSMFRMG
jgi:hypothetical protein